MATKAKKKQPTIAERIIKALSARKNGLTTDELAVRTGAKSPSVSSACSRLVRAGAIKRTDGGRGRGTEAVWVKA